MSAERAASQGLFGLPPRALAVVAAAGVLVGIAYTLSPLTVWFAVGFIVLCHTAGRGLGAEERRLLLTILIVAALLRLAVVAVLFVSTDHWSIPFGSLFGDEEYFKRRSLWLRSIALDVNISIADRIYAYSRYSETSYLYVLAVLQVLVGAAPYGIHVLSIFLYLAGAVVTHRFTRRSFGAAPAMLATVLILFLPTLFFWSVSALRESLHFLLTATALFGGVEILRAPTMRSRVAWATAMLGAVYTLGDLRAGSRPVVVLALVSGLATIVLFRRRRWVIAALAVAVVTTMVALSRAGVQQRLLENIRVFASNHQGHVFTPGLHYKLLEPRFYFDRVPTGVVPLEWSDAAPYAVRALVAFVMVPLPWQAETRLTQAYLAEHVIWLALALLFPLGVWKGWKYSRATTSILTAYVLLMGSGIALRSGNIGTLVRHRGLVLPFIICVAALAICHVLVRTNVLSRRPRTMMAPSPERIV